MKDYEEEASPFRMYPKDTVHCRGCVCGSRLDIGETSSQIQHTSTHHGSRRHSYEGKELCARNLFSQRRKERLSTPQKNRCSFEETGMADTTPSKFISGALDLLDCDDGSARMWENRIFKEGFSDNGFSSDDDINIPVYSQDEEEEEVEETTIAMEVVEDALLYSRYWNMELKKMKLDQSPRQKGINPLTDTGLLSPLGKLPARKSFPERDFSNRNVCKIHQDDLAYNHVNSSPSQYMDRTSEDTSRSKHIKDTYQKALYSSEKSVCLAFPKDTVVPRKKHDLHQFSDLEEIHKPDRDLQEQIIKHNCKDKSFVCSFKKMNENRSDCNRTYEVKRTPAHIWEEDKVHIGNYHLKNRNQFPVEEPIKVKLDIQATLETSRRHSSSPESTPSDSPKSPSKGRRPNKDRDKYNIFANVCTNEPHHKHRRLSVDSAISENSLSFCNNHKNNCSSYDKLKLFAQHKKGQSEPVGGSCFAQSEQNVACNFVEGTGALVQNALNTSPRYKCQKLAYDPLVLQSEHFWPGFVDTHCHLDFLFRRSNHDSRSHAHFRVRCRGHDAYPVAFEGCVAVFCQPWTFGKTSWWQEFLDEPNVWAAFGCHPHYTHFFGEEEEEHLRLALLNPKVVALGEIGLDYSGRNNQHPEQQKLVFRRQLKIALEFNKPLVIHCRDAEEDCLAILKELVPRDYLIHRHCFTEGWEEAVEWLGAFSNLYLGITGLVTFPNSERAWRIQDVLRQMPLSRLLLETDAPYFRPYCYQESGRWSNPGMAIHVAAQVAAVRGESIRKVLKCARNNTRAVYGV